MNKNMNKYFKSMNIWKVIYFNEYEYIHIYIPEKFWDLGNF